MTLMGRLMGGWVGGWVGYLLADELEDAARGPHNDVRLLVAAQQLHVLFDGHTAVENRHADL